MPLIGRTVAATLLCLSAMPALGVTVTFKELDIPQPRAISPDVIAAINGDQVFYLDAAFQKMGYFPLAGGPPVIVPLPAGPGRFDAEDAVAGPDSAIWSIGQLRNPDGTERSVIGRIPFDLSGIEYFNIPTATACSASTDCDIVAGPDGRSFFFTETREAKIGRIDLNRVFTEYPVLVNGGRTAPNILAQIAVGVDGKICATAPINNSVVCMTAEGRAMTDFRIGAGRNFVAPDGIVGHPNGNMYMTTDDLGLAQLSPVGVVTEFALPTADSDPVDIAVGADDVLYLASRRTKAVTRFDPITKDVLEVRITNGNTPTDIVTVPGASAEKPELVINAYNASFDFTPQKVTVDNSDTPPPGRPDLISGSAQLYVPPGTIYREGSTFDYELTFANAGNALATGTVKVSSAIPDVLTVADYKWAGPANLGSCTLTAGDVLCTTTATPEFQGGVVAHVSLTIVGLDELEQTSVIIITSRVEGGAEVNTSNNESTLKLLTTLGRARLIIPRSEEDNLTLPIAGRNQ